MKKQLVLATLALQSILGATGAWACTGISTPTTISASGSYCLSNNITATENNNGITITASDVTLDLQGYTIKGTNQTGTGIYGTEITNIEIKNGTVRDFGNNIDLTVDFVRAINIRSLNPADITLNLGNGAFVKDCLFTGSPSSGPAVGTASIFVNSISYDNGDGSGFNLLGAGLVTGSVAVGNINGIYVGEGTTVTNNATSGNQAEGISLGGNNLVDQNTAYGNNLSNQGYANISACTTCTFGNNEAP